jgi:hypothetical protein
MSTQIIAETRPAPECDLSPNEVEQFIEELASYHEQVVPAFRRPEQARWSEVYVRGLLGDSPRKTTERIALDLGVNVRNLHISLARVRGRRSQLWRFIRGWLVKRWGKPTALH